jgi:hypothetical protein
MVERAKLYRLPLFALVGHYILAGIERLFPLVADKVRGPTVRTVRVQSGNFTITKFVEDRWIDSRDYYILDDSSFRLKQRLFAVLLLDRSGVSFWRKREKHMSIRRWAILND